MDRVAFEKHLMDCNLQGRELTQVAPPPRQPLGLVDTVRVIRPAKSPPGALWVMLRDIYWRGIQQATHVFKVVAAISDAEDLRLVFDDDRQFVLSPPDPSDAATVAEFRRFAARPDSGYGPEAERVQAEALEEFVNDLEADTA